MKGYFLILLFLMPATAWAYFDIGTGTYLFQIALASFFGFIYTVRAYIGAVFRKIFGKNPPKDASKISEDNPDKV